MVGTSHGNPMTDFQAERRDAAEAVLATRGFPPP
jgi:hypothetical protein